MSTNRICYGRGKQRNFCSCFVNAVVGMAKEDSFSIAPAESSAKRGKRGLTTDSSPPKPEEGLRLVHAFHDIKQVALRKAIIKFVTELSTLQKDEL
jgi:hypothetical protein